MAKQIISWNFSSDIGSFRNDIQIEVIYPVWDTLVHFKYYSTKIGEEKCLIKYKHFKKVNFYNVSVDNKSLKPKSLCSSLSRQRAPVRQTS